MTDFQKSTWGKIEGAVAEAKAHLENKQVWRAYLAMERVMTHMAMLLMDGVRADVYREQHEEKARMEEGK